MPTYTSSDIRNIALVGHGGSGKTSLAEALMVQAGELGAPGLVERGDTLSDCTDEEKHHGHSLYTTEMCCDYKGTHINIIDTPGYPDFIGRAITALPAVETVICVIDAAKGIESVTRRMMEIAKQRRLCRMIVVNKIDAENVDLPGLVTQIQETFGPECLPINLPASRAHAVVDSFFNDSGTTDFDSPEHAHTAIVEQVVEVDEALMEAYFESSSVEPDKLHDAFEQALREGHLVPICFTSARRHEKPEESTGVDALLDLIVKLGPNPHEGNPRPFIREDDGQEDIYPEVDPDKHVLAHTFQIRIDPYVGKLAAVRVHQGTVRKGQQLYIGEARKPFKVAHLYKLKGEKHEEIDDAIPGDIFALAKIDELHRDSVLHDDPEDAHIRLCPIQLPRPMQGVAITARKRGDEQKIADALTKMAEEDPTFEVTRDSVTGETVIYGVGDLHLRIILELLKDRYHVEVDTKPPKIAYRETITAKAEGHHRHKKQTGGAGQFGEVYLRVEPLERGAGFEFVDEVVGGAIPNQFIPAVEKGVRQVLESGAVAGYPLQDIRVTVYDGKYHAVDSKEVAFVAAGKGAFIDGVQKARPVLLEPCVNLEVIVPNQHVGDITGDLSGKRGRIQGTDMVSGDMAVVRALVPLAEVMNYQSQLKSVTGGQGSYTMEFSHYEPVPPNVQQKVVAEYKPREEAD